MELQLPEKAPQTREEALEVFRIMDRTPQGYPLEREITAYSERFILPQGVEWWKFFPLPIGLLPTPIWMGPPVPWALWEMIGPTQKPIKDMVMNLLPFKIPEAHFYLFGTRIEGTYEAELNNIGEVLVQATGGITKFLDAVKRETGEIWNLIRGQAQRTKQVRPKERAIITFTFRIEGFWDSIRALWSYFWTRNIDVNWSADIHVPGYETEEYIVRDFDKRFEGKARLPVEELHKHWW